VWRGKGGRQRSRRVWDLIKLRSSGGTAVGGEKLCCALLLDCSLHKWNMAVAAVLTA
jgi:hypothetical protein